MGGEAGYETSSLTTKCKNMKGLILLKSKSFLYLKSLIILHVLSCTKMCNITQDLH